MEMDNLRGLREAGENILRGVSTRNRMKLTHAQVVSIDSESPQLICIKIHLFILFLLLTLTNDSLIGYYTIVHINDLCCKYRYITYTLFLLTTQ